MIKIISITSFFCFAFVNFMPLGAACGQEESSIKSLARGEIIERASEHSDYHIYIPKRMPQRILVIAHGTPGETEDVTELSKKFIKRWTKFADKRRLLLISVAFNRENFASDAKKFGYGGYRGLFGRTIGADEYVIQLVEKYQPLCAIEDGRLLLYGHSAGGQFLIRFCVMNPGRVAAAIASAPGRFAFPDPQARWPYGMKEFSRKISWSETESAHTVVSPTAEKFLAAAKLPITVLYGEGDTDPQPKRDAHPGSHRIDYGRGWVEAMNQYGGLEKPTVSLKIESGFGHDSSKATTPCQKALMRLEWVEPPKTAINRTWRSSDKKFKVDAKMLELSAEQVTLLTSDNRTIKVKIRSLSKTDLKFLEVETP